MTSIEFAFVADFTPGAQSDIVKTAKDRCYMLGVNPDHVEVTIEPCEKWQDKPWLVTDMHPVRSVVAVKAML